MHDLARRVAELAAEDDISGQTWMMIEISAVNTIVTAATKDLYADEAAAWEGAGSLWRAILELGYGLTDEGVSEIGAIRRQQDQDQPWQGRVRMVLHSQSEQPT
jgi:hypothetical protein